MSRPHSPPQPEIPTDSATSDRSGDLHFEYPGVELEAMAEASNYHRWIVRTFAPYLGRHIVEVGAGLGSFSKLILKHHKCETLSLVEPSTEMCQKLIADAPLLTGSTDTRVYTYQSSFVAAAPLIRSKQPPDSIIYINVLEHIADDELELDVVQQTLTAKGRVFLFVPALPWLYGAFDERVGHVRRYTKRGLEEKLQRAGFKTILSSYFDALGIAPWWIKYCLLRSVTMEPASIKFYDRFIVPAVSRMESVIHPPLGKNLIVVAEKS
jgi:hypothetical protein